MRVLRLMNVISNEVAPHALNYQGGAMNRA
jgi:hypothetical protein